MAEIKLCSRLGAPRVGERTNERDEGVVVGQDGDCLSVGLECRRILPILVELVALGFELFRPLSPLPVLGLIPMHLLKRTRSIETVPLPIGVVVTVAGPMSFDVHRFSGLGGLGSDVSDGAEEGADGVEGVTELKGRLAVGDLVGVGTFAQQLLGALSVSVLSRAVQRNPAILIFNVRVSAPLEQQVEYLLGRVDVVPHRCAQDEGRGHLAAAQVGIGPVGEQQTDGCGILLCDGPQEGRPELRRACVDVTGRKRRLVSAAVEEHLKQAAVAVLGGHMKRRRPLAIQVADLGSPVQQQPHHVRMVVEHRQQQRRVAHITLQVHLDALNGQQGLDILHPPSHAREVQTSPAIAVAVLVDDVRQSDAFLSPLSSDGLQVADELRGVLIFGACEQLRQLLLHPVEGLV
mmetsp:Transcript_9568/g.27580  ORF Transcript_9568/g.27580 Transcript_9568/m.27580 type:complete len:405 (+) Transcript_9568:582-1796(+)